MESRILIDAKIEVGQIEYDEKLLELGIKPSFPEAMEVRRLTFQLNDLRTWWEQSDGGCVVVIGYDEFILAGTTYHEFDKRIRQVMTSCGIPYEPIRL